MTIETILEQAQQLSPEQQKELVKRLIDLLTVPQAPQPPKTGAEIAAMIEALDHPIELVDPHIEDPVEWVKEQRRKEQERLKPYWEGKA